MDEQSTQSTAGTPANSQPSPGAQGAVVSARTRWSYALACIGRDATYTLVNTFLITYLTLGVGLTDWQLAAVGIVMVIARVWDAINDPMMGTIIDNTKSRWGKFKPYILCGALLNSVFTVLLFSPQTNNEKLFVVIFAITYILWGMTYTMNDISYWSLLPSLTTDPKQREKATSLARIGANIGLFATIALVPAITAGGMGSLYQPIAIAIAALFIACQILVVVGVQENRTAITAASDEKGHHTGLKDMIRIISQNDQLLVIAGAILLFNIGYFTTTAFGVQFFYFDYGNFGGMEYTLFGATIGVAQVVTLSLSGQLFKRWSRRQLFTAGIVMVVVGYLGLGSTKYLLPMNMGVICGIGLILFSGQAIIQLLTYLMLADTIEYGQWKLGTRNESVIYSLNPFITKLASAVQAGLFSATMIISGLNTYSNQISQLENEMNLLGEEGAGLRQNLIAKGNEIVAQVPESANLIMRISMMVIPLILIITCYIIYMKKYKIDEKFYSKIITDLNARAKSSKPAN